uniref:Pseudouridylate synthase RPUSD4, mitochondrial n=1 Tax=Rhipicephalus zambeziensis TaxID=60191 RepID=A0A224YY57_9ACAR
MLRSEVVDMLRQRVLYDGNDILILDKPYGMICHGSAKGVPDSHVLVRLLPDLSAALYPREDVKLYTVHRLDRDVTGAIVLAKTQRMADILQTLFEEHNISKTYHAITFGVPDNDQATIDMPLAEGSVGLAKRMVICPKLEPEFERLVPKFSKTYEAITHYRVLSSHGRAAYLEVKPVTGVKHQIRVHLGFGLRCPILGDHKYSHLRELAPQRLSGDLLDRLNVRQTKVRHIPMHLHASAVLIPEILDGKNLLVTAQLPYHFLQNLKRLKLQRH